MLIYKKVIIQKLQITIQLEDYVKFIFLDLLVAKVSKTSSFCCFNFRFSAPERYFLEDILFY